MPERLIRGTAFDEGSDLKTQRHSTPETEFCMAMRDILEVDAESPTDRIAPAGWRDEFDPDSTNADRIVMPDDSVDGDIRRAMPEIAASGSRSRYVSLVIHKVESLEEIYWDATSSEDEHDLTDLTELLNKS